MVKSTNWTTDQLADWLGCTRGHTTERIENFVKAVSETLLAGSFRGRPDRKAERALAILRTGGRLASADEPGLRRLLRELAGNPGKKSSLRRSG